MKLFVVTLVAIFLIGFGEATCAAVREYRYHRYADLFDSSHCYVATLRPYFDGRRTYTLPTNLRRVPCSAKRQ